MGNYISCSLSNGKHTKAAKVVFPTGEIKEFKNTIKAAELMFESPSFFLVNAKSLQIGRRFSALNADEDLEMANVYVMFPMKRLNSTVTTSDMGALFLTAKSSNRRGSFGTIKVLPESNDGIEAAQPLMAAMEKEMEFSSKLNLEDIEEFSLAEIQHRRSSFCRSKKPLLDTIVEEPGCSR